MNKKCYKAPMAKFHELRGTMIMAGSGDESNGGGDGFGESY